MWRRLKASRLALRIYLVGVAQVATVILGFMLVAEFNRPVSMPEARAQERALIEAIATEFDNSEALKKRLQVAKGSGLEVTVRDATGSVLATTVDAATPACGQRWRSPPAGNAHGPHGPPDGPPHGPPDGHPHGPRHGPPHPPFLTADEPPRPICLIAAIAFADGARGEVEFRRVHSPPPSPSSPIVIALVLGLLAISSLWLSRSLARPLRKLATAAHNLGDGDLSARTNIDRSDELGDVARAFDDMASRLAELVRAEKELVANVSHELRTPLARIRVALDIAVEGDADAVQESLVDIADDLQELDRLIADVLIAARLDLALDEPRGIPPLRKEQVALSDLLERAASRFDAAHPERPLKRDWKAALPTIEGDPILLRRALDNLLENAHKYTETASPAVALSAHTDDDQMVIEVRDHGIGIAAEDLANVFRPFFRVDRSRTRTTGGLGLGLALAKRIVEAHGGTISLQSDPDEGTVASVRLPHR